MAEKPKHPPAASANEAHGKDGVKKDAASHEAPAPASKKKKKKGTGPSLGERLKAGTVSGKAQLVDLFKSLISRDAPTRRMSALFFVSLIGVVAVGVVTVRRNSRLERERVESEKAMHEDQARRAEEAALLGGPESAEHGRVSSMLNLGMFTIALKPADTRRQTGSFVNLAEVELYAECDSKETHEYLEENLAQARNQLNGVFLNVDREELMTRDGKRKLKKRVLELLNGWLPHGKIRGIFFSKLIVG